MRPRDAVETAVPRLRGTIAETAPGGAAYPPSGWWQALPPRAAQVTGSVAIEGDEVTVWNGTPEREALLRWALQRFADAGLPAPAPTSVTFLPPVADPWTTYGFEPGTVPEYPGTLDYLVASVAGCLIGTFGGTLKARGITATGDDLVADAIGEVGVDDDNVLRLRRIVVRYTLKAAPEHREAAERCNTIHAHHCPNARSVAAAIDIVTELDFVPVEEKAGAPA